MNASALQILDDLSLVVDRRVVVTLRPSEAFDAAEQLVRLGMRRILAEEGADALRNEAPENST
ncbi:MAG: hypothetical protein AB7F89_08810 [Pirellulaceae bacterium]